MAFILTQGIYSYIVEPFDLLSRLAPVASLEPMFMFFVSTPPPLSRRRKGGRSNTICKLNLGPKGPFFIFGANHDC